MADDIRQNILKLRYPMWEIQNYCMQNFSPLRPFSAGGGQEVGQKTVSASCALQGFS
jgi:hypothetical protein